MEKLKDGKNLRAWSASARKELTPAVTVTLVVGSGATSNVYVPKLAFMVASPVIRSYFSEKPSAVKAKFVNAKVSLDAVHRIAKWLKDVCLERDFPELPVPDDLEEALKLRLTAYALGMERYTGHFDACYIDAIEDRVPPLKELDIVIENMCKKDDVVLAALANRLGYLCRYHKISQEKEVAFANHLAKDKYNPLLAAVSDEEIEAMAERELDEDDMGSDVLV
jgi:hypothetical protein